MAVHINGFHVLLNICQELYNNTNKKQEFDEREKCEIHYKINENWKMYFKKILNKSKFYIECLKKSCFLIDFILHFVLINYKNLIIDEFGCCFIQQLLEIMGDCIFSKYLILKILQNSYEVCENQWASFVIFYILKIDNFFYNFIIFQQIKNDLIKFSNCSYTSKCIEKLIELYNFESDCEITKVLLNEPNGIYNLVTDKFGNYGKFFDLVFQTLLKFSNDDLRISLLEKMSNYVNEILNTNFGVKFLINIINKETIFLKAYNPELLELYKSTIFNLNN